MRFSVLGSSSSGNAFYFEQGDDKLLIDAGFSKRYLERELKAIDVSLDEIKSIFISHEHSDHTKGLKTLHKTHKVYSGEKTINKLMQKYPGLSYDIIYHLKEVKVGNISVIPFKKNHDGVEPYGFIVKSDDSCVLNLTDFGSYDDSFIKILGDYPFTHIILESNYDDFMLDNGPYSYSLKKRINGPKGHISNLESLKFLHHLNLEKTSDIILCHLSENNNSPSVVKRLFDSAMGSKYKIHVARSKGSLFFSCDSSSL